MRVLSFFATNTATGIRVISDKISHDKSQVFTTHGHFQEDLSHRNFANNHEQPWRTIAVADTSLAAPLTTTASSTGTAVLTTNNVSQAFDTAKSVAAENQPAGADVMMAIHNNNTEGAIPLRPSLH